MHRALILCAVFVLSLGCGKETPKAQIPTNPAPPPAGVQGMDPTSKDKGKGAAGIPAPPPISP